MDELRILAAGAGSKVLLLHETDLQRLAGASGPQSEVAYNSGSVNSASQDEHVEWRCLQALDLLRARVRHSVTSLVYLAREA
jgi:hypothetical protein